MFYEDTNTINSTKYDIEYLPSIFYGKIDKEALI